MDHRASQIQTVRLAGGAVSYHVNQPPESLPAVRSQDLTVAWDLARDAAEADAWGVGRCFSFRRADGTTCDLALSDEDACCWAGAVDAMANIGTSYGLALCLRLLALVDLLGRAQCLPQLFRPADGRPTLHPALLATAAQVPLDGDARFDEALFRARLATVAPPTSYLPGVEP